MVGFWDSSALLPLLVKEPTSEQVIEILVSQKNIIVWWASLVECQSAMQRRLREGSLELSQWQQARLTLDALWAAANEITPSESVRRLSIRLLCGHPLRAADALQLAAALVWCRETPGGNAFVCLDSRLRTAALIEGFTVLP